MTIAFGSAALRALRRVVSCSAGPRVHSRGTRAVAPPRSFLDADVICELAKMSHALAMRCASIGAVAVACVESVSAVIPPAAERAIARTGFWTGVGPKRSKGV